MKLALILLALTSPAFGALTFVKACNVGNQAAGITSQNLTCSTTAGDLLIAMVSEGTNATDAFTFTDNLTQTWTSAVCQTRSTQINGCMFYIPNSAAISSVTATYTTGGGITAAYITVLEFSGAATSSPVDGTPIGAASVSSGTSLTSGALTTSNANDVLVSCSVTRGVNVTAWTETSYTIDANATNNRSACGYQIVSSTQSAVTTTTSWTTSATAINIFSGFKQSAGSAAPTQASPFVVQ